MPDRAFRDYYDILGVAPEASTEEIVRLYRELARLYHPDTLGGKSEAVRKRAEQELKRVNEAYECLRDAKKRAEYDAMWRDFHGLSSHSASGEQGSSSSGTQEKLQSWQCSDCGCMNSMVRSFCGECGSSRDEALEAGRRTESVAAVRKERRLLRHKRFEVCPACGDYRNAVEVRFCGGCGEDLDEFWSDGPCMEEYKNGLLATYGLAADEVFESVLETFAEQEIHESENVKKRVVVTVAKGIFDRRAVEIRVAERPGRGCDLIVIPGPGSTAEDYDFYDKVLFQVHETIRENRFA